MFSLKMCATKTTTTTRTTCHNSNKRNVCIKYSVLKRAPVKLHKTNNNKSMQISKISCGVNSSNNKKCKCQCNIVIVIDSNNYMDCCGISGDNKVNNGYKGNNNDNNSNKCSSSSSSSSNCLAHYWPS